MTTHRELTAAELDELRHIRRGLSTSPGEDELLAIRSHLARQHHPEEADFNFTQLFYQHLGALNREEINLIDLLA